MLRAFQLKSLVVGPDHPIVITFDTALCEKGSAAAGRKTQLEKEIVPKLGELHAGLAALRGLGNSIKNSGIDDAWIEAGI